MLMSRKDVIPLLQQVETSMNQIASNLTSIDMNSVPAYMRPLLGRMSPFRCSLFRSFFFFFFFFIFGNECLSFSSGPPGRFLRDRSTVRAGGQHLLCTVAIEGTRVESATHSGG
jgi:hypothetical protein